MNHIFRVNINSTTKKNPTEDDYTRNSKYSSVIHPSNPGFAATPSLSCKHPLGQVGTNRNPGNVGSPASHLLPWGCSTFMCVCAAGWNPLTHTHPDEKTTTSSSEASEPVHMFWATWDSSWRSDRITQNISGDTGHLHLGSWRQALCSSVLFTHTSVAVFT